MTHLRLNVTKLSILHLERVERFFAVETPCGLHQEVRCKDQGPKAEYDHREHVCA